MTYTNHARSPLAVNRSTYVRLPVAFLSSRNRHGMISGPSLAVASNPQTVRPSNISATISRFIVPMRTNESDAAQKRRKYRFSGKLIPRMKQSHIPQSDLPH